MRSTNKRFTVKPAGRRRRPARRVPFLSSPGCGAAAACFFMPGYAGGGRPPAMRPYRCRAGLSPGGEGYHVVFTNHTDGAICAASRFLYGLFPIASRRAAAVNNRRMHTGAISSHLFFITEASSAFCFYAATYIDEKLGKKFHGPQGPRCRLMNKSAAFLPAMGGIAPLPPRPGCAGRLFVARPPQPPS